MHVDYDKVNTEYITSREMYAHIELIIQRDNDGVQIHYYQHYYEG